MMAATATRLTSSPAFDDPLMDDSLGDFEEDGHGSPLFGLPSQHSGFKSSEEESTDHDEEEEVVSEEPWSPPAWRSSDPTAGWYRHQPYAPDDEQSKHSASASRSREVSHESYVSAVEEDEEDTTRRPCEIPLPRGSQSPARNSPVKESSPIKREQKSASPYPDGDDFSPTFGGDDDGDKDVTFTENNNNYFRFALRAEVQQRTEPIEAVTLWIRSYVNQISKTWGSLSSFMLMLGFVIALLRILTHTPIMPPLPDLVKVAGLARSFEPLIYYSENGVRQVGDLQETGVAVWDLGESVRHANMTSTPVIVRELDSLSESLKGLAMELTSFFANVDGDIDGILIVMDWAKRELDALSRDPSSSLSSAFTNIHSLLSMTGIFENRATGMQTPIGKLFTTLFGTTKSQRTHYTLHRTFNEFLGVLEESINAELTYSTALFALFETIDRQFLNLQRTVIREKDTQEREETEFLSSLWTRMVGPDQIQLKKYERNKALLASVRSKTTQNKSLLVEHNGKLVALKGNLEMLRRKLMSPLVSRKDGSTLSVEDQVRGLEGTYEHLRRVREQQKGRMLEVLYGAGGRRSAVIGSEGAGRAEIDS